MVRDFIFYHWSDVEDTGMDYPILQHLTALQGAVELYVQQCEAREREAAADGAEDMADDEDVQPPAKRRQGWDVAGSGGTDTPIIPLGDLSGVTEEDFSVLDAELPDRKPTPTAGVIKALKADTKQALAASCKGKTGAKGKSKDKNGKGKTFHLPQEADQVLDALLKQQAQSGTPASGAESGSLGSSASSASVASVALQRSATEGREAAASSVSASSASGQLSQPPASSDAERTSSGSAQPSGSAAAEATAGATAGASAGAAPGRAERGSGAGTGATTPTPSPIPLPSGAQEEGNVSAGGGAPSAAGQPLGPAPSNQ